jgi:hypothetical protein
LLSLENRFGLYFMASPRGTLRRASLAQGRQRHAVATIELQNDDIKRLTDGCGARNGFGFECSVVNSIAELAWWMGGFECPAGRARCKQHRVHPRLRSGQFSRRTREVGHPLRAGVSEIRPAKATINDSYRPPFAWMQKESRPRRAASLCLEPACPPTALIPRGTACFCDAANCRTLVS